MEAKIRARYEWVKLYAETRDAGYVCRRCGISRPTLRKWARRFQAQEMTGLIERSRRPNSSPQQKIDIQKVQWIIDLRAQRNLGARRIQTELLRLHECTLGLATIHKVLKTHSATPIKRLRRKKQFKRYQRAVPGDRIQMDTCKIFPGIYQYTAVDDCSRWRVLELYTHRTAANTLHFIEVIMEQFPFPIQRIQTDRGREFFAVKVQEKLMEYGIKFRPIKPRSPHLNGKVERSQKTDLEEFYAIASLSDFGVLKEALKIWQFFYNWQRPHGALNGQTPAEYSSKLSESIPLWEEVSALYDSTREHIQEPDYQVELALRKLKRCL